jgi:hypothetical protein
VQGVITFLKMLKELEKWVDDLAFELFFIHKQIYLHTIEQSLSYQLLLEHILPMLFLRSRLGSSSSQLEEEIVVLVCPGPLELLIFTTQCVQCISKKYFLLLT